MSFSNWIGEPFSVISKTKIVQTIDNNNQVQYSYHNNKAKKISKEIEMKNVIDRIKGFMQGFFRYAMVILSSAFTDDKRVLVPIRVQNMTDNASKRNPYAD